jgi:PAS domain S-box-containing protein
MLLSHQSINEFFPESILDCNIGFIATGLNRQILAWNKLSEQAYGYKRDDVLQQSLALIYPPGESSEVLRKIQAAERRHGYFQGPLTVMTRAGNERIAHSTIVPIIFQRHLIGRVGANFFDAPSDVELDRAIQFLHGMKVQIETAFLMKVLDRQVRDVQRRSSQLELDESILMQLLGYALSAEKLAKKKLSDLQGMGSFEGRL